MRTLLLLLEVVFVLVVLWGVALVFVPAALILGGTAGVVAVERLSVLQPARRKERRP